MSRVFVFAVLAAIVAIVAADNGCGNCLTSATPSVTYNLPQLSADIKLTGAGCPGTCPITLTYAIDWCITKTATVPGGYEVNARPFVYVFNFTSVSTTSTSACVVHLQDTASGSGVTVGSGDAVFTDADGGQLVVHTSVPKCLLPPPTTGTTAVVTTGAATTGALTPAPPPPPSPEPCVACGDPHFQGLNGQKFEFMGEAHKTFAIISDPVIQLNSLFVPARYRHTFFGQMCLRVCGGDVVTLAPTASIHVNGKQLAIGHEYNNAGRLTVKRTSKHEVEIEIPNRWSLHFRVGAHIDIVKAQPHFAWDEKTHGVLGHTLKPLDAEARGQRCNVRLQGGCNVEGDWTEYLIESGNLCSTKWTHSMFDTQACL